MRTIGIGAAAILALAASASAQNVLVWSTGNSIGQTGAVAAWLQASGQFTSVTGIDQDSAFTLDQLDAYDRVLYFSNTSAGQDPDAIGDVLDQYAATGKRLVLAVFSWANQGGNTLGGDIIEKGTSPFVLEGVSFYTNVSMQSNDGSAFFAGVNSLTGFFHDNVALADGAVPHGTWSDGERLLASKGNVVGVNLFPDDSFGQLGGDYKQLFINSLTANVESECYPDCDEDGVLSIDDFICFQTLFAFEDKYADCDEDGSLTIDDFICFQTLFAVGCP